MELWAGREEIPAGPCAVEQSEHAALLSWREDGIPRQVEIGLETLRGLLASGQLSRQGPD